MIVPTIFFCEYVRLSYDAWCPIMSRTCGPTNPVQILTNIFHLFVASSPLAQKRNQNGSRDGHAG